MTTKIRIPSSEDPPPLRSSGSRTKSGRFSRWFVGAVFVALLSGIIVASIDTTSRDSDEVVPEAFPATEINAVQSETVLSSSVPTVVTLRGSGTTMAAGVVGSSEVAVTNDVDDVLVWSVIDDAWTYVGEIEANVVSSVRVTDDRVIVVGSDRGIPSVWEWVDGQTQLLFQPPSGWIMDAWSIDGRLLVVTSSDSFSEPAEAVRFGRRDELWNESDDGTFNVVELENMTTVLTVFDGEGLTVIGGSDDGRPSIGYLNGDRVLADRIPTDAEFAGVTDVETVIPESFALVSIFGSSAMIASEIRAAGQNWAVVAVSPRRLQIDRIGGRIVTFDEDGAVSDLASGVQVSSPPFAGPAGSVSGMDLIDGSPLIFGSSNGQPALAFWGEGARLVSIPEGAWRRYHSEVSDGFHLIHVGSREFAMRGAELFVRAWNADRWHPADFGEDLVFFGQPSIVETEWGFVLAPLVGSDLWRSLDGDHWEQVSTDLDRTLHLVSNGVDVVALSKESGTAGSRTTDVAVVSQTGVVRQSTIPVATIQPGWSEGVGFYASVPPPQLGYVVSDDGLSWDHVEDGPRYDLVSAIDGGIYWSSGQSVRPGDLPIEFPGDANALIASSDDVLGAASGSGEMWIWTGRRWTSVGFGVADGLPGRPLDLVIRNGVLYAFVEAGVSAEVWALDVG